MRASDVASNPCTEEKSWICKRSLDADWFLEFPGRILFTNPWQYRVERDTLQSAKKDCLALDACTGFTLMMGKYTMVQTRETARTASSEDVAYIKTACSRGSFGSVCNESCSCSAPGSICNPLNGVCDYLLLCKNPTASAVCDLGMNDIRCPQGPKWLYYDKTCYYVESQQTKTWPEANRFCRSFVGGGLPWRLSMGHNASIPNWIGKTITSGFYWISLSPSSDRVPSECYQALSGEQMSCYIQSNWICKKNPDGSFFEVLNMLLVSSMKYVIRNYSSLDPAREDCINAMEKCTGIVEQEGVFYTVRGKLLAKSNITQLKLYIKTDCKLKFFGISCEPCPFCPEDFPCNPWTGLCDKTICVSEVVEANCKEVLSAKCPLGWLEWKEKCYLIEKIKRTTWPEARLRCRHFLESDLAKMETNEEKDKVMTMQAADTWVGLHYKSTAAGWNWADGKKVPAVITGQGNFWIIAAVSGLSLSLSLSLSDCRDGAWKFPDPISCIFRLPPLADKAEKCGYFAADHKLKAAKCSQVMHWICKRSADIENFFSIRGRILFTSSRNPSTLLSSAAAARQMCKEQSTCTGFTFWSGKYELVTSSVTARTRDQTSVAYLKTHCAQGYHGTSCQACECRFPNSICNSITGQCDESYICLQQSSPGRCEFAMKSLRCPEGPDWYYWDNNCYYLEKRRTRTWHEALRECTRFRATDLMYIEDKEEKAWLLQIPLEDYWIGVNNLQDTATFTWSEGTPVESSAPWLQISNTLPAGIQACVKVSPRRVLLAVACVEQARWICKRSADAERFERFRSRLLLSPMMYPPERHSELSKAKSICLSLTDACSGISTWRTSYVLVRGTELLRNQEPNSSAYVKTDCSMGFSGKNCSSICDACFRDDLCNPQTGACNDVHFCHHQDAPGFCRTGMKSLGCPPHDGWWCWEHNCYFFSTRGARSWLGARDACRRYKDTDLLWFESRDELKWLLSKVSPGITWTGLNNKKWFIFWHWANETSAKKTLSWLKLFGSVWGRCVGIDKSTQQLTKLSCENSYRWACKKRESAHLFETFPDRYMMKPFASPDLFSSLADAQIACLLHQNCTAVVQIQDFFRILAGHDEIHFTPASRDPAATIHVKRICTPGFFGDHCSGVCAPCHGNISCNSVTGGCPQPFTCVAKSDSELCERALTSYRCPQDPTWYYWSGHCYYIETKKTRSWEQARSRCEGYRNSSMLVIDSTAERGWVTSMLTSNVWLGLWKKDHVWTWSSGQVADVTAKWFLNIRDAPGPCAQLRQKDGSLVASDCSAPVSWVCEKKAALDMFLTYPGRLLLSMSAMAEHGSLAEAKLSCVLTPGCKGLASWPDRHVLVSSTEMVAAGPSNAVHLKTSCVSGYHGHDCSKVCRKCYSKEPCNSLTGSCDDATSCSRTDTLLSCARSVVSVTCPDAAGWKYWKRNCYYIAKVKSKSWYSACAACSHYRNSALVWLENAEELAWLSSLVTAASWTGLQDIDRNQVWSWSFGEDATNAMAWFSSGGRDKFKQCAAVVPKLAKISAAACGKAKNWVCKKAADLDMYSMVWDAVMLSMLSGPSAMYTDESLAREACLHLGSKCAGFAFWTDSYVLMGKTKLTIGGFGDSVAYLKSVCNFQYYGPDCVRKCPRCYGNRPCNSVTGQCDNTMVCAEPESKGTCELGQYSLRCPLDSSWRYWNGQCYKIEKARRVPWQAARAACGGFSGTRLLQLDSPEEKAWVKKMVPGPAWTGISRETRTFPWKWTDGSEVSTSSSWLQINEAVAADCVYISSITDLLQAESCLSEIAFVCERPEAVDMFLPYPGHIVTLREKLLPVTYSSLQSAKAACLFERDRCTGVVGSQDKYVLVSGKEVFRSTGQVNSFYLKTGCRSGYSGTHCQAACPPCPNGLPCSAITGVCVGTANFTCTLQSVDPRCSGGKVSSDLCPFRHKWYYFQSACYYVEDQGRKTWAEARERCRGFKETDLIVMASTMEKAWVLSKNTSSWIGLTYRVEKSSYVWIDGTTAGTQSTGIFTIGSPTLMKQKTCVSTLGYFLVSDVCSSLRGWICQRAEDIDLYTEYPGKSLYSPRVSPASIYTELEAAKNACRVRQNCTGVVLTEHSFVLHSSTVLFNSWKSSISTLLKTDCRHGRYGAQCENTCPKCLHSSPCNAYSGLCSDHLYCSKAQNLITCEDGYIFSGTCPTEDGWWYWNGNCYYFQTTRKSSWTEAEQLCRQYRGARLLWVASAKEQEWLLSKTSHTSTTYWTGLWGHKYCSVFAWSYSQHIYTAETWLPVHKKTRNYECCAQFAGPAGSLAAVDCSQKHSWVCKRNEEVVDIIEYSWYYLVGSSTSDSSPMSLQEAVKLCRFQRSLCNGILKNEEGHRTVLASQILLIRGYTGPDKKAYLKSACDPGYYGPECREMCECNVPENCNPFTGDCVGILQCLLESVPYRCQRGVLSLKCPRDPGWWYWNDTCYYIEARNVTLSWQEASDFCTAYNGTHLLQLDSEGEKSWISSLLNASVWIGVSTLGQNSTSGQSQKAASDLSAPRRKTADAKPGECLQLDAAGSVRPVSCRTPSFWVCERKEGYGMFWRYPGRVLLRPWERFYYSSLEFAQSACLLEPQCTGVTRWKGRYAPVMGTRLVFSRNQENAAYLFTACREGRYGSYCQARCPSCPGKLVCNRITGKCDGSVTCQERNDLTLCEYRLTSTDCFSSWRYWNGSCYYFAPYVLAWQEASAMCRAFKGAQLLKLNTTEEQTWVAKIIVSNSWIGLRYNISTGRWFWADDETAAPAWDLIIVMDYLAPCVQMLPVTGAFAASVCSRTAPWICKGPEVPGALQTAFLWWSSLVWSVLIAVSVVVASIWVTYGTVSCWRRAEGEEESYEETESEKSYAELNAF
ncbi:uncharacterized protein LOC115079703 [Rhinatrema bivittatum]|uniref:uncharacterized protein LOC115079703 n=1 Tax=Rhinatrema bivittatum TaxID=194408 RepID=UPI00112A979F|nr:uncharacterized protein LOC115079703 [Rhinatrema bivittatum]